MQKIIIKIPLITLLLGCNPSSNKDLTLTVARSATKKKTECLTMNY